MLGRCKWVMAFAGLNIVIPRDNNTENTIRAFWEEMVQLYSINALQGLIHSVTEDELQYAIGFNDEVMTMAVAADIKTKLSDKFNIARYKMVWIPVHGWVSYHGKLDHIELGLKKINDNGDFSYQLHRFTRGKRGRKYVIMVNKRNSLT